MGGPKDLNDFKNQVKDMSEKIDRILSYLENDPKTGREGLYTRQCKSERRIARLEGNKKFLYGIVSGISLLISSLITLLTLYFKK